MSTKLHDLCNLSCLLENTTFYFSTRFTLLLQIVSTGPPWPSLAKSRTMHVVPLELPYPGSAVLGAGYTSVSRYELVVE